MTVSTWLLRSHTRIALQPNNAWLRRAVRFYRLLVHHLMLGRRQCLLRAPLMGNTSYRARPLSYEPIAFTMYGPCWDQFSSRWLVGARFGGFQPLPIVPPPIVTIRDILYVDGVSVAHHDPRLVANFRCSQLRAGWEGTGERAARSSDRFAEETTSV